MEYSGSDGMYYLNDVPLGKYTLKVFINPKAGLETQYPVSVNVAGLVDVAPIQLDTDSSQQKAIDELRTAFETGSNAQESIAANNFERTIGFKIPPEVWSSIKSPKDIDNLLRNISSPRVPTDFKTRLSGILQKYKERELYLDPIPEPKLQTATTLMSALGVSQDEVVGLLNTTVLGSAERSMLFGLKGIYYRTRNLPSKFPESAFIDYRKLATTSVDTDGPWTVLLGSDRAFNVAGSGMSASKLRDLLNSIRTQLLTDRGASAPQTQSMAHDHVVAPILATKPDASESSPEWVYCRPR